MMSGNAVSQDTPNLLFDAVCFGLHMVFAGCDEAALERARHVLKMRGELAGQDRNRLKLRVPIPGGAGHADAELCVQFREARLVFTSASSIRLNPLRLLRLRDARSDPGPGGLDGNNNVIGPTLGNAAGLLDAQLCLVEAAFKAIEQALERALPASAGVVSEEVWLRSAEVCVDIGTADAFAVVRSLQRAALAGAVMTQLDGYSRGAGDDKGVPAVRWRRTKTGPVFKAYAKLRDLVRAELACLSPDAIKAAMGARCKIAFKGGEAAALLLALARASEPKLLALVDQVLATETRAQSPAQLMIALSPLISLAAGRSSGRGRPPGASQVDMAKAAIDALMTVGIYRALGPKEGALRGVLDALAAPSGPLERGGHYAIYSVRPQYARVVDGLA